MCLHPATNIDVLCLAGQRIEQVEDKDEILHAVDHDALLGLISNDYIETVHIRDIDHVHWMVVARLGFVAFIGITRCGRRVTLRLTLDSRSEGVVGIFRPANAAFLPSLFRSTQFAEQDAARKTGLYQ